MPSRSVVTRSAGDFGLSEVSLNNSRLLCLTVPSLFKHQESLSMPPETVTTLINMQAASARKLGQALRNVLAECNVLENYYSAGAAMILGV